MCLLQERQTEMHCVCAHLSPKNDTNNSNLSLSVSPWTVKAPNDLIPDIRRLLAQPPPPPPPQQQSGDSPVTTPTERQAAA
mmetsp:Transcript_36646/g.91794  ORF Transcript_36646/g.91794 Transcript_36646/m.91794 type:complete len:81 (+) Transcript_36646:838-1080(+)